MTGDSESASACAKTKSSSSSHMLSSTTAVPLFCVGTEDACGHILPSPSPLPVADSRDPSCCSSLIESEARSWPNLEAEEFRVDARLVGLADEV